VGTYILGQGWADSGAQGAAVAAERSIKKGAEVSAIVQAVLGARMGGDSVIHDDNDDGPSVENNRKELLG